MTSDEQLQHFREKINLIDADIIVALGNRLRLCIEVGHLKKTHGIAMMQPARVEAVKARCAELGSAHGLRPEFVRDLYDLIIQEACFLETEIIEGEA